jgi:hypothetical protein
MGEAPTPGEAEKLRQYGLRLDGSATLPEFQHRLHFECNLTLSNRVDWAEFDLQLHMRPLNMEVHSKADEQSLHIYASDGDDTFARTVAFSELRNPQALVASLAGPMTSGMLEGLNLPAMAPGAHQSVPATKWEAHHDVLTIGHQSVRVYRLNARIMDQFDIVAYVSSAGEIFRVELPDDIVLLHDKLSGF